MRKGRRRGQGGEREGQGGVGQAGAPCDGLHWAAVVLSAAWSGRATQARRNKRRGIIVLTTIRCDNIVPSCRRCPPVLEPTLEQPPADPLTPLDCSLPWVLNQPACPRWWVYLARGQDSCFIPHAPIFGGSLERLTPLPRAHLADVQEHQNSNLTTFIINTCKRVSTKLYSF